MTTVTDIPPISDDLIHSLRERLRAAGDRTGGPVPYDDVERILRDHGLLLAPAAAAPPLDEMAIRRDERSKIADLFAENRETIQSFLKDSDKAVDLLVFLLRLAP